MRGKLLSDVVRQGKLVHELKFFVWVCLVPPGSTCLQQEQERRSDERGARSPAKYPVLQYTFGDAPFVVCQAYKTALHLTGDARLEFERAGQ